MRLIDADELIKKLDAMADRMILFQKNGINEPWRKWCFNYGMFALAHFYGFVKSLSTVEAEPVKHGKWIDEGYYADYTNVSAWRCSECGWHMVGYADELFRYCPSCGAKLEDEHGKPCDDCQEFDCYGCKYAERKEE